MVTITDRNALTTEHHNHSEYSYYDTNLNADTELTLYSSQNTSEQEIHCWPVSRFRTTTKESKPFACISKAFLAIAMRARFPWRDFAFASLPDFSLIKVVVVVVVAVGIVVVVNAVVVVVVVNVVVVVVIVVVVIVAVFPYCFC